MQLSAWGRWPRLGKARPGIRFNEHIEGDGPTVFSTEAAAGYARRANGATQTGASAARQTGAQTKRRNGRKSTVLGCYPYRTPSNARITVNAGAKLHRLAGAK